MLPHHFNRPSPVASGSAPAMYRRSSYSPPRVDTTVRRPSALRESRSACDLIDDEPSSGSSSSQQDWHPSPTESDDADSMSSSTESLDDLSNDYFSAPACGPSSSSASTSPKSHTLAIPPITQRRRPCGLSITPLSNIQPRTESGNKSPSTLLSTGLLPKAQPLGRTLFARMADTPHAGTGLLPGMGKKTGGKQKMIVATKPMRTTFELGLTSKELARKM